MDTESLIRETKGMYHASSIVRFETRLGNCAVRVVASEHDLLAIQLNAAGESPCPRDDSHAVVREAVRQLREYFAGKRKRFELPLYLGGTEFQQRVWRALCEIPYGETRSYGELAAAAGAPRAVRAVGAANGSNPIPIVVPCHRVIGASGKLVGYGGGLAMKKLLLDLEARHRDRPAGV